jgi:DNA-binding NtrC family response regulator
MILPVLIIGIDSAHRNALASIISNCGLRPISCGTLSGAKYFLVHQQFTAILYELAENQEVGKAVKEVSSSSSQTPIVVVSHIDDWDSYLSAIAAGAFDYIDFPPYPGELERVLCLALKDSRDRTFSMRPLAQTV